MTISPNLAAFATNLEARARAAENVAELGFSMANDSHPALHFRQALVIGERVDVVAVSGLAKLTDDSPYLIWLKRAWPWVIEQLPESGWFSPSADQLATAPGDIADGWQEWWPTGVQVVRLTRRAGEPLGWVAFLLDQPPASEISAMLDRVAHTWAYCWEMLAGKPRRGLKARWQALNVRRRRLALLALGLLCLFPVRQTVLAPAEIVPVDAMVITAALDGVIKTVHVRPNEPVKAGDRLFSLDDTTLRNRLEITGKSVAVADAELQAATQMAFNDSRSRAELATLIGRAQERRAELNAVQAQLSRIDAIAPYDGVAVFADPDDWQGKPVVTGERIMLLANPDKPGMLIHLPVADAITLDHGAPVKLFLTVHPLSPVAGEITETSYQATLSPDGIASYRLRASVASTDERIGLRGTAKLYGDRVVLGYYLMRKPLAKLREWTGW